LFLFADVTLFSLLEAGGTTLLPLLLILFDLGEPTMDELLPVLLEGAGSAEKDTEYTGAASVVVIMFDLGEPTMDELLPVLLEGTGSAEKDTAYTGAASVVVTLLFVVTAATAVLMLFGTHGVFSPRSQ
jgi:hypothetical protein